MTKKTKNETSTAKTGGGASCWGKPDPVLVTKRLADEAARREVRHAERPSIKLHGGPCWDELPKEALTEIFRADCSLAFTLRRAETGASWAPQVHEGEPQRGGTCTRRLAVEADEAARLSAEDELTEVLIKHGPMEPGTLCMPSLLWI